MQNKNTKKIAIRAIAFGVYFILFAAIVGKLFFENQFNVALRYAAEQNPFSLNSAEELIIGFSDPYVNLSPLSTDSASRNRILAIFEPLVSVTPDLEIKPALAISYGILDDVTWEFRLRPGVRFHNGRVLTIDDVIYSIETAREIMPDFIAEILETGNQTFEIRTYLPDPLFLNKLSQFLIFPQDVPLDTVIGTGPYRLLEAGNGTIKLAGFERYWGDAPDFSRVTLQTFHDKQEKLSAMVSGEVDIVASVPSERARNFDFPGFSLVTSPSLESNFLMFNFKKQFADRRLREAAKLAINLQDLADLVSGFAVGSSQFAGKGIFGFNPQIAMPKQNIARAKALVKSTGRDRVRVALDLPEGFEVFGSRLAAMLKIAGFEVELRLHDIAELGKIISEKSSEFFFFGWKNDLADSGDFLAAVAHSAKGQYGQFNGGSYANQRVDDLIELSQWTVSRALRLKHLREAMRIITEEDLIGVPLFVPESLYAVSETVKWTPRVDGYILAQEVEL